MSWRKEDKGHLVFGTLTPRQKRDFFPPPGGDAIIFISEKDFLEKIKRNIKIAYG